jgi:hypothetical protein
MGWREGLIRTIGPGFAAGIAFGDWIRLLSENGFRVRPGCWPKAASATLCSLINTPLRWLEHALYNRRIAAETVRPPLFVLGHYRSGTTHLHNLLAVDGRFAYPRASQVGIPHNFLLAERVVSAVGSFLLPRTRLGVDNMALRPHLPTEEESALALTTLFSPYLGWMFPERAEYYGRYLTFRGVSREEVERWKAAYVALVKKLTWKDPRPLILKSPPNTCRIRLILETFPGAKFVHIHRNPWVVYQSMTHLMACASKIHGFQRVDLRRVHGLIMQQYKAMYDAFFEERHLIPAGRFCEVAFEDLESDPVGQMCRTYRELGLPDFAVIRPAMEEYVRSLGEYKKNVYSELPRAVRSEIAQVWHRCFEEWKYPMESWK